MVIKITDNVKIQAAALISFPYLTIHTPVLRSRCGRFHRPRERPRKSYPYAVSIVFRGAWRLLGQMQINPFIGIIAATVLLASKSPISPCAVPTNKLVLLSHFSLFLFFPFFLHFFPWDPRLPVSCVTNVLLCALSSEILKCKSSLGHLLRSSLTGRQWDRQSVF